MTNAEILKKLIDDILEERKLFNEQYDLKNLSSYNLNRTSFSDVINDDAFMYKIIPNYLKDLNNFVSHERLMVSWELKYDMRYRVKHSQTLYMKIKQYYNRGQNKGSLRLKKSLNDLLGFRIILPGIIEDKDDVLSFLKSEKENGKVYRYYLRSDHGYYGIHCYFAENNFTFPWELQIWDVKSKIMNSETHKIHEEQRLNESEGNI